MVPKSTVPMEQDSKKDNNGLPMERKVFYCKPGSFLCFKASMFWHATVTFNASGMRDLMLAHTFIKAKKNP